MAEACEDAAAEGVTHLEIRFAPHLHAGAPLDDIVDAAVEEVAGRAGIILCGLYGNHPQIFDALVDLAGPRLDVVGIDLAGGPLPDHRYGLRDYAMHAQVPQPWVSAGPSTPARAALRPRSATPSRSWEPSESVTP